MDFSISELGHIRCRKKRFQVKSITVLNSADLELKVAVNLRITRKVFDSESFVIRRLLMHILMHLRI